MHESMGSTDGRCNLEGLAQGKNENTRLLEVLIEDCRVTMITSKHVTWQPACTDARNKIELMDEPSYLATASTCCITVFEAQLAVAKYCGYSQ